MLRLRLHGSAWSREYHYGRCGQSYPCCRAAYCEYFGSCPLCLFIAPRLEDVFGRIQSYLHQWNCTDLTRATIVRIRMPLVLPQHQTFTENVFRIIVEFLGTVDTRNQTGTVVMKLVRMEIESLD